MVPRPSTRKRKRKVTKEGGDSSSRLGGRSVREPMQQEGSRQRFGAQRPGSPFFSFLHSIKTFEMDCVV
jgi:hypothetical protein